MNRKEMLVAEIKGLKAEVEAVEVQEKELAARKISLIYDLGDIEAELDDEIYHFGGVR